MNRAYEENGSSLIEIIAALVIFSMVAAGLAIAIPMAYGRVVTWQAQFNLGRYLEKQLEDVRSHAFTDLPIGDTGFVTEGNYQYRWVTNYVINDETNHTWDISNPGTGDGLAATYYVNSDFTGLNVKRIDPTIDFNWGLGSPDPGIQPDDFSARWIGYVEPQYSESYTFYVNADDEVKVWVNNQLLIDKWEVGSGEWSGSIDLTANVRYSIKVNYFESADTAIAQLSWSSPSILKTVIPQSRLYSSTAKMTVVTVRGVSGTVSLDGRVITFDNAGAAPEQ
ncbi:MAG TPA: hypothetical protein DDW65_08345 [Firmicutes bacterium]|jgi:type II secretory pathway pseudopilin PulG|nr:hypothetical protein [Bacillota bacterium]